MFIKRIYPHPPNFSDSEEDKEDNDEKSENFGCSLMQQKFSLTPITEPNVMTHGTLLWLIGNLHDDDNAKYGKRDFVSKLNPITTNINNLNVMITVEFCHRRIATTLYWYYSHSIVMIVANLAWLGEWSLNYVKIVTFRNG